MIRSGVLLSTLGLSDPLALKSASIVNLVTDESGRVYPKLIEPRPNLSTATYWDQFGMVL